MYFIPYEKVKTKSRICIISTNRLNHVRAGQMFIWYKLLDLLPLKSQNITLRNLFYNLKSEWKTKMFSIYDNSTVGPRVQFWVTAFEGWKDFFYHVSDSSSRVSSLKDLLPYSPSFSKDILKVDYTIEILVMM